MWDHIEEYESCSFGWGNRLGESFPRVFWVHRALGPEFGVCQEEYKHKEDVKKLKHEVVEDSATMGGFSEFSCIIIEFLIDIGIMY